MIQPIAPSQNPPDMSSTSSLNGDSSYSTMIEGKMKEQVQIDAERVESEHSALGSDENVSDRIDVSLVENDKAVSAFSYAANARSSQSKTTPLEHNVPPLDILNEKAAISAWEPDSPQQTPRRVPNTDVSKRNALTARQRKKKAHTDKASRAASARRHGSSAPAPFSQKVLTKEQTKLAQKVHNKEASVSLKRHTEEAETPITTSATDENEIHPEIHRPASSREKQQPQKVMHPQREESDESLSGRVLQDALPLKSEELSLKSEHVVAAVTGHSGVRTAQEDVEKVSESISGGEDKPRVLKKLVEQKVSNDDRQRTESSLASMEIENTIEGDVENVVFAKSIPHIKVSIKRQGVDQPEEIGEKTYFVSREGKRDSSSIHHKIATSSNGLDDDLSSESEHAPPNFEQVQDAWPIRGHFDESELEETIADDFFGLHRKEVDPATQAQDKLLVPAPLLSDLPEHLLYSAAGVAAQEAQAQGHTVHAIHRRSSKPTSNPLPKDNAAHTATSYATIVNVGLLGNRQEEEEEEVSFRWDNYSMRSNAPQEEKTQQSTKPKVPRVRKVNVVTGHFEPADVQSGVTSRPEQTLSGSDSVSPSQSNSSSPLPDRAKPKRQRLAKVYYARKSAAIDCDLPTYQAPPAPRDVDVSFSEVR